MVEFENIFKTIKTSSVIVIICLPFMAFAQLRISGSVKDSIDALSYANVVLLTADGSKLISGGITDIHGNFLLTSSDKGHYKISISYVGYKTWEKELVINGDIDLGVIYLDQNDALKEVVVIANKPSIQKVGDKLIFNVENSAVSQGFDATEVLKNVPRVDPTSESLKLIGKASVMVLLDGRLLNLSGGELESFLKTIRSENIHRIEVMTTPPAKYDASENSGIVNIVLKKNMNSGFDGSVSATYSQRQNPGMFLSPDFTYSRNKLSASFGAFLDRETKIYESDVDIMYQDFERKARTVREANISGGSCNLSLDYQINKMFKTGIVLNGNLWETTEHYDTKVYFERDAQVDSSQTLPSFNDYRNDFAVASFYYDINLDSVGKKIGLNYNYLQNDYDQNIDLNTASYEGSFGDVLKEASANNTSRSKHTVHTIVLDVSLPFDKFKIESGGKLTFTNNNSDLVYLNTSTGVPIIDHNQSNSFSYDEQIIAVYFSIERSFSDRWFGKMGGRFEGTETTGISNTTHERFSNRIETFFPSVFLSYDINDNTSFSLGFSRRINRPDFDDVNPFRSYVDSYNYVEGNPRLQPATINNLEFSALVFGGLSLETYYSITNNGIGYVTLTSEENPFIVSRPENLFNQRAFGVDISYTWNLSDNLKSSNSFSVFRNHSHTNLSEVTIPSLDGFGYFYSNRSAYLFGKDRRNSIFVHYYHKFPSTEGLSTIDSRSSLTIGTALSIFKEKISLNLSISDIFRQANTIARQTYLTYRWQSDVYTDQRRLNLTLTYKFGNKESKSPDRSVDDSEKTRFHE